MEEYWWGVHKLRFEQRPLQELDSVLLSGRLYFWVLVIARHQKAKESSLMRRSGPGWLLLESDYPDSLDWLVLFL